MKITNISFTTIGDVEPCGICGSGLIDIAANLIERGIVLPNGRFNKDLNVKIKDRLRDKKFYITRIYMYPRRILDKYSLPRVP